MCYEWLNISLTIFYWCYALNAHRITYSILFLTIRISLEQNILILVELELKWKNQKR